ncbi:MAG TPA: Uma2 family endonuclease, partial [Xanthobacteraceae bacterium]|nr:Uma2 family endonuclease [Xanthobacteraceae bacterium]
MIHQRIASNLERLLNDALEIRNPRLAAYQRVGVDLRPDVNNYDPEPDVVVVDNVVKSSDQRYVDRFYLAAEVVSDSDG